VYVAQLNRELNRDYAADSVIVCAGWGIHFVQALYGPRSEVVLSVCSLEDRQQLQRIAAIARRLHRHLTFVGYKDDWRVQELLRSVFPEIEVRAEQDDKNPWRIWWVPYEKLGEPDDSPSVPTMSSSAATTVP